MAAGEIAAILGLSPFQTRLGLWERKLGLATAPPPVKNPRAAARGVRLEPVVAQEFADRHPEYDVVETGMWRHMDRKWQRAAPDRVLYWHGQLRIPIALLEVKTSPTGEGFGPDGSAQFPVGYRAQVQWQMDTLGVHTCHVIVRIGVCDACDDITVEDPQCDHEHREYVIDYDPGECAAMRTEAADFLAEVKEGRRPAADEADPGQ
ncbi:YqaJ viral recombinase family protein [Streptomyces sp. 110]|uniref:YqaJ viral recombinase family protein n=1 Tax=Streptomyces endocoffeicus TaxID=2898945 RepID=A0ABS1PTV6_9ACTN|nr:YqaJ viral recombinase family protein [Streptomyces endocoffeicus]